MRFDLPGGLAAAVLLEMEALVVCHAGVGIGLGHMSRCRVIAKALSEHFAAQVRWLIQGDALPFASVDGMPLVSVPLQDDWGQSVLAQPSPDLLVLDLHAAHVPVSLGHVLRVLRSKGTKVIAIDGLLAYRAHLDLIFIPSFHFQPTTDDGPGAPIVHGWDCYLLDERLQPMPWEPGSRVLVLTGGSDATGLGQTWPALLDERLPEQCEVHWVTGPFASPPLLPKGPRLRWVEHLAPDNLVSLMQETHYAVTVYGVSFFELMRIGVPTVVFSPYGKALRSELSALREFDMAVVAENPDQATDRLVDLISDSVWACKLSSNMKKTLESPGVSRLLHEISRCF